MTVGTPAPTRNPHSGEGEGREARRHKTANLGRALVAYLGGLTLSGGDCDGELMTVLRWERRFVLGTFRQDGDAALSVARGNGKSGLVAGIACAVVDPAGPLHGTRREVVCVASSFEQGRVIFEDALAMLRTRYPGLPGFRVADTANRAHIQHRESGARIRCVGSDPKRAHGLRPMLVLADEPAQWPGTTSARMISALRTGLGKVPGSKLVALGTRPDGGAGDHWFARMLDGGAGYSQTHAAPATAPPFRLASIRRANPSWAHLPSLRKRVLRERDEARRDEVMLQSWRALRLNQGVSELVEAMLLSPETWAAAEGDVPREGPAYWGVDLGGSAAQSAVAAYWPATGRLEALAAFPRLPSLQERGLADGVGSLYVRCWKRGDLIQAGERAANVEDLLREAVRRFGNPEAIAGDRWRDDELLDALETEKIPGDFEARGMGFRDGSEDVRLFRRAFLTAKAVPVVSLLMRAAMAESRTVSDPAGNAKLAKAGSGGRRARARDDAAAAAVQAVALGMRRGAAPVRSRGIRYAIVGG